MIRCGRLVLDQGWPEAGITMPMAVLLILVRYPKGRASFNTVTMPLIRLLWMVRMQTLPLICWGLERKTNNLKIKYIRWIKNVNFVDDALGRIFQPFWFHQLLMLLLPGAAQDGNHNIHPVSLPSKQYNFGFLE